MRWPIAALTSLPKVSFGPMRQIVLDTETTGLELADGHRIIEIGCIELVHRRPSGRTWQRYLQPERDAGRLAFLDRLSISPTALVSAAARRPGQHALVRFIF